MDINLTFIVQGFAFFAVAWLVMKFGWPHIIAAIEERQQKIAEGLAAADHSQKDARAGAGQGQRRAEAAPAPRPTRSSSRRTSAPTRSSTRPRTTRSPRPAARRRWPSAEIAAATNRAREDLRKQVSALAVTGAEKLLQAAKSMPTPTRRCSTSSPQRSDDDEPGPHPRPSLRPRRVLAARRKAAAPPSWSQALGFAARVAADPQVAALLGNPQLTHADAVDAAVDRRRRAKRLRATSSACSPTTAGCRCCRRSPACSRSCAPKPSAWSRRRSLRPANCRLASSTPSRPR